MLATNHLGHFALTHHLAPLLAATPGSRIVTTGSFAAKSECLDLDDLQSEHDYRPKRAYARSKLAQMFFALELDRRLRAAGSTTLSVVVHPGGALDSLTPSRPPFHVRTVGERLCHLPLGLVVQGKDAAAWPAVRAVLDPDVRGGQMWSPRQFGLRGAPRTEPLWNQLADTTTAARLWAASCDLTGIDLTPRAPAGFGEIAATRRLNAAKRTSERTVASGPAGAVQVQAVGPGSLSQVIGVLHPEACQAIASDISLRHRDRSKKSRVTTMMRGAQSCVHMETTTDTAPGAEA